MTYTIQNKHLVLGVVLAILATFSLGGYLGYRRALNVANSQIVALKDTINSYKIVIGGLTKYVTEKDQLITDQREALQRGELERKELRALNLKRVNELTALKIRIDTLLQNIPNTGTVVYIDTCMGYDPPQSAILLPFSFEKADKWMTLRGDFDQKGQLGVNLRVNASVDVWTGIDKSTKQYKAVITSDNPYLKITDIKSMKFDLPKPKKFGLGVFAGYGITVAGEVRAAPMIGVGLNYNLIMF